MSNKQHVNDLVQQQNRYESLIITQGAYLMALAELIRDGKPRKEIIKYLDKYGIGK